MKLNLKLTSLLLGTCVLAGPSASAMDPHDHSSEYSSRQDEIKKCAEAAKAARSEYWKKLSKDDKAADVDTKFSEKSPAYMDDGSQLHLITFNPRSNSRAYAEFIQSVYELGVNGIMVVGDSENANFWDPDPTKRVQDVNLLELTRRRGDRNLDVEICGRTLIKSGPLYNIYRLEIRQTSRESKPHYVEVVVYKKWDLGKDIPSDLGEFSSLCSFVMTKHNKPFVIFHPNSKTPISYTHPLDRWIPDISFGPRSDG